MPGSPLASNPPWTLSLSRSSSISQSSATSTTPTSPFPSIPPGPNSNPFVHIAPQTPPTTPEALGSTNSSSSRSWNLEHHREWVQSLPSRRKRQPSSSSSASESSPALEPEDWKAQVETIFARACLSTSGSGSRRSRTVSAYEVVAVRVRRGAAVWGDQERVVDGEGGSERERRPASSLLTLDDRDLLQPYYTPTRSNSSSGSTMTSSTATSSTGRGHQRTTPCPGTEVQSRKRQSTRWYTPPSSPGLPPKSTSKDGCDSPRMRRRERIGFEEVSRERASEARASGSEDEGGFERFRRGASA